MDERSERLHLAPWQDAKYALFIAAAMALCVWWLLSDREPTHKEMTFAYRAHVIDTHRGDALDAMGPLREKLHRIELKKQGCEKVVDRRYRCLASVMVSGLPAEISPSAGQAIYYHDSKGWRFEPSGAR